MERVLFTGLTGKSGSVLVEELARSDSGKRVRAAVRPSSDTTRLTELLPDAELRGGVF